MNIEKECIPKEYTLKIKVDTTELDEAIKKLNKLVKKIKAHQIV